LLFSCVFSFTFLFSFPPLFFFCAVEGMFLLGRWRFSRCPGRGFPTFSVGRFFGLENGLSIFLLPVVVDLFSNLFFPPSAPSPHTRKTALSARIETRPSSLPTTEESLLHPPKTRQLSSAFRLEVLMLFTLSSPTPPFHPPFSKPSTPQNQSPPW